jgi:hypothetical protein
MMIREKGTPEGGVHCSLPALQQALPGHRRLYRAGNGWPLAMSILGSLAPYVAGTVAGLFVFATLKRQAARRTLPYPPGPKPLPLIGNMFDFPKEKEWLTYRAWNERYGDVVYAEALGTKLLVLGSIAVVNELMEGRGAIYSTRPSTVMMNEL